MCVYSMVYDHFNKKLPDWDKILRPTVSPFDWERWAKDLDDFKKASKAAKRVDDLTGQPDCQDPEKAKLEERVAALEAKIAELAAAKSQRCAEHPRYQAKRPPRSGCPACLKIWYGKMGIEHGR